MKLPGPRDLKDPPGWRFSSLRKMRLPAEAERVGDSIRGVRIQGVGRVGGVEGEGREPIFGGLCWEEMRGGMDGEA